MTALCICAAVAALLLVLLLLPLGVDLRFTADGPSVLLCCGPVKKRLLPAPPRVEKKRKQQHRPKETPSPSHALGGSPAAFWPFVRLGLSFLSALRRRLLVRQLTLLVQFDGQDPARAAVLYGQAQALISALWPHLTQAFRMRRPEIAVRCGFTGGAALTVYLQARLRLHLVDVLMLLFRYGPRALHLWRETQTNESEQKPRKAVHHEPSTG